MLFRVFDILKPYPINLIDKKIKNGTGVVLDDIIASIYAAIAAFVIIYFTPWQLKTIGDNSYKPHFTDF